MRLEHLEQLVQLLSLIGDGSSPHGKTTSHQLADQQANEEESSIEPGAPVYKESVFNGLSHWPAMQEDIEGLRSAIIPSEASTIDDD